MWAHAAVLGFLEMLANALGFACAAMAALSLRSWPRRLVLGAFVLIFAQGPLAIGLMPPSGRPAGGSVALAELPSIVAWLMMLTALVLLPRTPPHPATRG